MGVPSYIEYYKTKYPYVGTKTLLIVMGIVLVCCGDGKKYHDDKNGTTTKAPPAIANIVSYQQRLNAEFKNPETSPLPDRLRIHFEGLDFFDPDTTYIVKAHLERTPNAEPFLLPTTTNDKTLEKCFAVAHFKLNGKRHRLEVYQSLDLIEEEGYEDYLFLPFFDETNGDLTYGGGRYIDLRVPKGDTLIIDFNRAYNPYCVYNKKYSCPLVPRQNNLKTKVMAGVKDFNAEK